MFTILIKERRKVIYGWGLIRREYYMWLRLNWGDKSGGNMWLWGEVSHADHNSSSFRSNSPYRISLDSSGGLFDKKFKHYPPPNLSFLMLSLGVFKLLRAYYIWWNQCVVNPSLSNQKKIFSNRRMLKTFFSKYIRDKYY